MKLQRIIILLTAVMLLGLPAASMNFIPTVKQSLNFTVYRDDSPIGYHKFDFQPRGDVLQVDINVDLEVKLMFITAFKFTHVASETWEAGRLLRMESETDDDGDPYKVIVQRRGEGLLVEVNGEKRLASGDILPSNLWNRAILSKDKILHPILGKVLPLTVTKLGERDVEVPGSGSIVAEGFKIDGGGQFQRELWYAPGGRLVEVGFNAPRDGSRITYRLN
ncbi:MAG: hypothetical protein CFH10_00782 [Alphaproteobacteria bacterium MarineAlpha4_Bin2]|nr:MAG: hypothetical protein CFH10_00782 [Alphaproteobacteria bacterium MarineAlpha4_Bin2]